jgi:hypothetical protein
VRATRPRSEAGAKLAAMRLATLCLLAVAGLAGCGGGTNDQGVTTAPTPSGGGSDVVFPGNCDSGLTQEPSSVVVTCADQGITVEGIQWQAWGADTASGNGTAQVNDCKPDCVAGTVKTYDAAQLELTAIKDCGGHPQYTALRLSFNGQAPPGFGKSLSENFPCA